MNEIYLGDSIYVREDPYENVILYLNNGLGNHSEIEMEPDVLENFLTYIKRSKNENGKQVQSV